MTNPIDLCTVADVRAYIGGDIPTASDDLIQALITAASQYAMSFCARNFKSASYSEVYDGTGTTRLLLKQTPVTAVASVSVDGLSYSATTSSLASGFQFDDLGLFATGCSVFPYRQRCVSVAYTAGYTTVPFDLSQAVVEMVADKYKRRANIGIQARAIANETITYTSGEVPKSARVVLLNYMRVVP